MPRIISGIKKGLNLIPPKNDDVRPTYDRAKEGLFNILASRYPVEGGHILDLFSGTGSIGLECISRGADRVVFVDKQTTLTKTNIDKCGFTQSCDTIQMDCIKALAFLKASGSRFTHVFLDPPYNKGLYERVIENECLCDIIDENSVVIAELSDKEKVLESCKDLILMDKRKYGISVFAIYRKRNNEYLDLPGQF
ncbi:MAG: 16S rRNA (guanine(966)-N(2))-methyltransferase RsmD [Clostridia bacterium]|jgi:16S rRNA (guanine(966)-N(2))-methyltransferase RsmD